jgi:hypothetical protein
MAGSKPPKNCSYIRWGNPRGLFLMALVFAFDGRTPSISGHVFIPFIPFYQLEMFGDLYLVVNDGYLSEIQTTLKVCLSSHSSFGACSPTTLTQRPRPGIARVTERALFVVPNGPSSQAIITSRTKI